MPKIVKIAEIVEADRLLTVTGQLDTVREKLDKMGKTVEAQVLEDVYTKLLAEVDPDIFKVAKKMTQQQKQQMRRKMKMHRPLQKKWMGCKRPVLRTVKGGKKAWVSTCQYVAMSGKNKGKTMTMTRIVGRNPTKKPTSISFKGKKVRWL